MIGNRRSDILNLIINHYIQTGEPVGSKMISQLPQIHVSAAIDCPTAIDIAASGKPKAHNKYRKMKAHGNKIANTHFYYQNPKRLFQKYAQ